ncbi:carotenoid oxygenase family protein [Oleomonas cavernae]|nr:carotenoid oxygenase family protein [Oleomonas cavernae]
MSIAQKHSPSDWVAAFTSGLYAPVNREVTGPPVAVIGEIPRNLNGIFVQNTPNPAFAPNPGHSWFDGDGMVHGVQFEDGKATYRNRYVRTKGLDDDIAAGKASYSGSLALPGQGPRHKNVANTDLVHHNGRLLALWWEGGEPYELSLPDLKTIGTYDYNGTLNIGMTSHVKLDPATGELHFISWGTRRPYLSVGVADATGRIARVTPVELPGPRVQHDVALSNRYVGVFDFPLMIDMNRAEALGFVLNDAKPARIGLVDRRDESAPVRWFEIKPCFMWHLMCAWDEGDDFVLLGARLDGATRVDARGQVHDDRPMVDGEHRFDSQLYQWRLNTRDGTVREGVVDDLYIEFPRVNDAFICSGARFGYAGAIQMSARTLKAEGLAKFDLKTGRREQLRLPRGHFSNEPCFAAADASTSEDDGYVLSFVSNEAEATSELWIEAAQDFTKGPVARIKLPQRVPAGFHTRWIPAAALR